MTRRVTRQAFLRMAGAAAAAAIAPTPSWAQAADDDLVQRVSLLIQEYDRQGNHRTGSRGDVASGQWLITEMRRWGVRGTLERFALARVEPVPSFIQFRSRRVEGVPLFDGAFTGADGAYGRLGLPGEATDFVLVRSDDPRYAELRRTGRHAGVVVITAGAREGLTLLDAPAFASPFGPPVLQVGSDQAAFLEAQAREKPDVRLVADATRQEGEALNVVARVPGRDPRLPPAVFATGRSAWYQGASERGGALVCWIEVLRALAAGRPVRDCLFVATSGDELGQAGLKAFLAARADVARGARGWLVFGANLGAAQTDDNLLAASADDLDALVTEALAGGGVTVDARIPRGEVPTGAAAVLREAGAPYVSIGGRGNPLERTAADRWPRAVDVSAVARYARAFVAVARQRAGA